MASTTTGSQRENWKKEKELEEARKAGTAEPLKDEEGRDINPHIPQYISQAPWYLNSNVPSLKHQRNLLEKEETAGINAYYSRGVVGEKATAYRKGACENCGAMTHKKKDCTERPRKTGARFTNKFIAPDEIIQEYAFDYEGKRDRWNGFDPSQYETVYKLHELREQEARRRKANDVESKLKEGTEDGDGEGNELDNDNDAPMAKHDPRTRTTVRNLRIREDKAKYLYNLDVNSAYYDPMTRSLRGNPLPHLSLEETPFAGDNFVRFSGDTTKFNEMDTYAWQSYEKGSELHLQALPTATLKKFQSHVETVEKSKMSKRDVLTSKYGGEEHLDVPPPQLIYAQTENYVEYDRSGKVIKGKEIAKAKSKYEEDVFPRNHTSVWGSFWRDGRWGYKCCHQFERNSFCLGDALKRQAQTSNDDADAKQEQKEEVQELTRNQPLNVPLTEKELKEKKKLEKKKKEEDEKESKKRLERALREEDERGRADVVSDDRLRSYNSGKGDFKAVTDEELEAYHMKRARHDDPMANYEDK